MKKTNQIFTNKILSFIMAMILMCLSMVCVSAEDIIADSEHIEQTETNNETNYEKHDSLTFKVTNNQSESSFISQAIVEYSISEEHIFINDSNEIMIEGIGFEEELMPLASAACYYRANNWNVRDSDVDIVDGMVQTTAGISAFNSISALQGHLSVINSIYSFSSVPNGLKMVGTGSGHYEIRPTSAMTLERYKVLIGSIKYSKIN